MTDINRLGEIKSISCELNDIWFWNFAHEAS